MHKIVLLTLLITISSSKLIYIADLANPGAHYPLTDVYNGKNYPTSIQGQLNAVGMRQQYLLGTYLRADYIDSEQLVPKMYNPNTIQVFAITNVDRTYDSALSRLYGLYPTGTGWTIPEEVAQQRLEPPFSIQNNLQAQQNALPFALQNGFQPIPIWPLDDILNDDCTHAGLLKSKRLTQISKNISAFQAQQTVQLAKLKLLFNLSATDMTIPTISDLYDTVLSDMTLGVELPSGFNQNDLKNLKYISDYYNTLLFGGNYSEIFSTLILHAVKDKMDLAKSHKIKDKKWSMFFTKQGTISPLLTVLNLTSVQCLTQKWKNQTVSAQNCMQPTTMSSNLILELHEDDSFAHYLKLKYNGQYVSLCEKTNTQCEYNNFWNRLSLNLTKYHESCEN